MPKYFAFLRAINVGGHTVRMERLQKLFESMGFADVGTFIASGNIIFTAKSRNAAALERQIESNLYEALGYEVVTFLRSTAELSAAAHYQPFAPAQIESAAALNVAFLKSPLSGESVQTLMSLRSAIDDFHVHGREMYWLCLKKQSESAFSNALFEKTLKISSTLRGMNTIRKMAEKYLP